MDFFDFNNSGTSITELMTKELGFVDEALRINEHLFFYKHPSGYVRIAFEGEDVSGDIETLEQLLGIYYYLTGRKLLQKILS